MITVFRANGNTQDYSYQYEYIGCDIVRVLFPQILLLPGDALSVKLDTFVENKLPASDYNTHRE